MALTDCLTLKTPSYHICSRNFCPCIFCAP